MTARPSLPLGQRTDLAEIELELLRRSWEVPTAAPETEAS